MRTEKRSFDSSILGRESHIDIFTPTRTKYLFVVFGGSGIDEEEYVERSKTIIPVFDSLASDLERSEATLVHITAPYDVPLARFSEKASYAVQWNSHVLGEVIGFWKRTPFFLCGFSGGSALGFHGIHSHERCFGGAVLGFDGLTRDFECPKQWKVKLQIHSASHDHVCNHPDSLATIDELVRTNQAELTQLAGGSHRISDYIARNSLSQLITFSKRAVPR